MPGPVVPDSPPKSSPDVSKLSGMTSRVVQVTRHMSKTGPGHLVQPAWKSVSVDQIIELQTSLPRQYGAGTYHFEVYDEGGSEKDIWTVKLGPDTPEASSMPPFPYNGVPGVPFGGSGHGAPGHPGHIDLGHGFVYNESLGLLTTPSRQIYEWRPGTPLPGSLGTAAAAFTPYSSPYTAGSGMPPWGTLPATDAADQRVRALEEALRAERDTRREEERRRDATETRAAFEKAIEETNRRFEMLITKLGESRTSPETEALKQEVERRREESQRAEMRAQAERTEHLVRELTANKTDPMLPMLTQIMTASTNSGAETVKAMRDTTQSQAQASERNATLVAERLAGSIMTPLQIVDLMRVAKDQSANSEINKGMVDMFKNLFGMAQGLVKDQAEMYAQASGPAWLPVAQQTLGEVGRAVQVYAQAKANAAAGVQPPRIRQHPGSVVGQGPAGLAAVPPPVSQPQELTAEEIRAAAAAHVFPQKQTASSVAAAQMAGARRRRPAAPPVPAAAPPPAPPPASPPAGVPVAAAAAQFLAGAPTADVKAVVDQLSDQDFFGPALSQIARLREAVSTGLPPVEVANAMLMSRQYFTSFGELPPCIELLEAGHLDILVDRILPASAQQFRVAVADALRVQLRAEASGGDGDDEAAA